ncbi:MAG: energy-coupling factor ABC transporter permease [Vulcanimicrobiota bacterium]
MMLALHIPDGFLPGPVGAAGWLLALPALLWSLYQASRQEEDELPLAGLLAAFVFAAQSFQFPIPGGTTGHLIGATLVTILAGPGLAFLVLTCVILLQALLFGDGGLVVMGWNLTNMGVLSGFCGGSLFLWLTRGGAPRPAAGLVAAWIATQAASLATCLELAAGNASPLVVSLPAMAATQSLVGVGEGLVTAGAIGFLARTRPGLLRRQDSAWPGGVGFGLLLAGCLAAALLLPSRPLAPLFCWLALCGLSLIGYGVTRFIGWRGKP